MKLRWPFISQKRDDDMTTEMAFHIESKTRELVDAGMSEADARLEARRRFGSVLKQKEAGHEIRTGRFFEDVMRDVRHMGRGLAAHSGLHDCRRPHACARHRRQHRDLLRRRSIAAAAAAVSRRRKSGHGVRGEEQQQSQLGLAGDLARLAARQPNARTRRGVGGRPLCDPDRRG